jgi:hypothetical protein
MANTFSARAASKREISLCRSRFQECFGIVEGFGSSNIRDNARYDSIFRQQARQSVKSDWIDSGVCLDWLIICIWLTEFSSPAFRFLSHLVKYASFSKRRICANIDNVLHYYK